MIVEVIIEQDGAYWFAMSHREVDYFAEGASLSEVVENFIGGFTLTLHRNNSIHAFLFREAPATSVLAPKGELHRIVTRDFKHEQSQSEFTVEFRFWFAAPPAGNSDNEPVTEERQKLRDGLTNAWLGSIENLTRDCPMCKEHGFCLNCWSLNRLRDKMLRNQGEK